MSFWQTMMLKARGMMFRRAPLMITCAEFEGFILDYLEGRLTPMQRRVFDLHLRICKDCRSYLQAYRRSVELGKAVFDHPDEAVPDEVPEDLVVAILEARAARE